MTAPVLNTRPSSAQGAALIAAMLLLALVGALGAAVALASNSESAIAGDFVRAEEARYAAEAGLERAIGELPSVGDWTLAIGGVRVSTFTDGPPSGVRALADGTTIDLAHIVNLANCGKTASCSSSDLTGNATGQRPWGANNPVWRPFAYGPLTALAVDGSIHSSCYVVVLVADDPAETDGNPLVDGVTPCAIGQTPPACNPGSGAIALRAEAFGPRAAHRVVETILERAPGPWPVRTRSQLTLGVR